MRVAIAGGHGKVGLRLTRLLGERGDEVVSFIRHAEQADDVREASGTPFVCDLESASEEEIAVALDSSTDAVVFAAGAGPGSGPERKWTVDYGAAVKLIAAAEATGTARYVMLSSIGADPDREGDDAFSVYLRAKGKADAELMASGLDHTIVRPTFMTDDPGTGRVRIAEHVGEDERVSRDDVAAVLAAVLHRPETGKLVFEVASGDVPIEEALASAGSPA
jgi:nucleoside-diphosphate-sugar epimerase